MSKIELQNRLPTFAYIVVGLVGILFSLFYFDRILQQLNSGRNIIGDFTGYYAASRLIVEQQDPYNFDSISRLTASENLTCVNCRYRYLPFFATTLIPIVIVSPDFAQDAWIILNVVFLGATIWLGTIVIAGRFTPTVFVIVLAGVISFYSIREDSTWGNVSILLGFLATLTYWLWRKERRLLAGVVLGIGITIKFFPAILVLYFLCKREFRIIVWSIVTTLILMVLPDLILGQDLLQHYLNSFFTINSQETIAIPSFIGNQSLRGFFARLELYIRGVEGDSFISIIASLLVAVSAFGFLAFVIPGKRSAKSPLTGVEYFVVLTLFALALPNAWSHYYAWSAMLIPALAYVLINYAVNYKTPLIGILLVGIAFASHPYRLPRLIGYEILVETLEQDFFGMLLQSSLTHGLVILVVLSLYILYVHRQNVSE